MINSKSVERNLVIDLLKDQDIFNLYPGGLYRIRKQWFNREILQLPGYLDPTNYINPGDKKEHEPVFFGASKELSTLIKKLYKYQLSKYMENPNKAFQEEVMLSLNNLETIEDKREVLTGLIAGLKRIHFGKRKNIKSKAKNSWLQHFLSDHFIEALRGIKDNLYLGVKMELLREKDIEKIAPAFSYVENHMDEIFNELMVLDQIDFAEYLLSRVSML